MLDRTKDCICIAATGAVTAAGFGLFDLDFGGTRLSHHEAWALWVAQPYVVLGLALIGLAWLEYEGVRWARWAILAWYPFTIFGNIALCVGRGIGEFQMLDLIPGVLFLSLWLWAMRKTLFRGPAFSED